MTNKPTLTFDQTHQQLANANPQVVNNPTAINANVIQNHPPVSNAIIGIVNAYNGAGLVTQMPNGINMTISAEDMHLLDHDNRPYVIDNDLLEKMIDGELLHNEMMDINNNSELATNMEPDSSQLKNLAPPLQQSTQNSPSTKTNKQLERSHSISFDLSSSANKSNLVAVNSDLHEDDPRYIFSAKYLTSLILEILHKVCDEK